MDPRYTRAFTVHLHHIGPSGLARVIFILLDRVKNRPVLPAEHLPGYPVAFAGLVLTVKTSPTSCVDPGIFRQVELTTE